MPNYQIQDAIDDTHPLLKKYPKYIAQLLVNRGIQTEKEAETFLNPEYLPYDPFLLLNLEKTIDRIHQALQQKEHITIYADYDADGIPGASILSSFFDKLGYDNYDIYLPHRHDEGYGIHIEALEKIKENNTSLIITIDVGITGHEAVTWVQDKHIDMIITDHHLPLKKEDGSDDLPQAFCVVNPKQETCHYPDPMLCGSGVIFKVIEGFLKKYREEYQVHLGWEKWLLDMLGIATLSDMVPLRNENRIFAHYGMEVMKKTKRKGLIQLLQDIGTPLNYITEEDITFSITPKINAASRMSHPEDALSVFRAQTNEEVEHALMHLTKLNNERKKLVAATMKEAYAKLEKRQIGSVIVIGSPDWQAGILGLVASKLVERYQIPAFVWSEEQGAIKGSCRTYNGIHLVELMSLADPESFIQFGGHKEAGGFSSEKKEIHFLQERLEAAYTTYTQKETKREDEVLLIDMDLSLQDITVEFYQKVRELAPFGVGNPKPLFCLKNIVPEYIGQFGKTKEHLEIHFKNTLGKKIRAITFFKEPSSFSKEPKKDSAVDLLAHLEYSVFRGKHELRLKIVDFV